MDQHGLQQRRVYGSAIGLETDRRECSVDRYLGPSVEEKKQPLENLFP